MWSYHWWSKCRFPEFSLAFLALYCMTEHTQLLDDWDHQQAHCWEGRLEVGSLLPWPILNLWSPQALGDLMAVIHSDFADFFDVSCCISLTNAGRPLCLLQMVRGTSVVVKSLVCSWKWCTNSPGDATSSPGRQRHDTILTWQAESHHHHLSCSSSHREEHQLENLSGKAGDCSWPGVNLCASSTECNSGPKTNFSKPQMGIILVFSTSLSFKDLWKL